MSPKSGFGTRRIFNFVDITLCVYRKPNLVDLARTYFKFIGYDRSEINVERLADRRAIYRIRNRFLEEGLLADPLAESRLRRVVFFNVGSWALVSTLRFHNAASGTNGDRHRYADENQSGMKVVKILQFIALVLGAISLAPAGAHLFSLLNKIHMTQKDYFVAQTIYNGWALFGVVLFCNLIALSALAFVQRGQIVSFILVLISLGCQLATLTIFFVLVFPANQATKNWSEIPANWESLRWRWEYGHAVDAVIAFAGFCVLTISVLWRGNK